MDKQKYHNRLKIVQDYVFDKGLSKILFNKMVIKAESDSEYMEKFLLWLSGKESTVFFRDELASVFEKDKFITNSKSYCAYYAAWVSIDSASLKIRGVK